MRLVPLLLLPLFGLALEARYSDHDDHYGPRQSPTQTAASSTGTSGTGTSQGGSQCTTLMCITGIVNGSNVEWVLSSTGQTPGWMAIGFGTQMTGSPMVIMWANNDGSVTLSQRKAPGEVTPSVDPSPPRIATLSETASSTSGSGSDIKFAFTIPSDGSTSQKLIWAFSSRQPTSSDTNASLDQHLDSGTLTIDLSGTISSGDSAGNGSGSGAGISLKPYQKLIIGHALLCVFGFLLFLPAGALLARYLRTFTPTWYTGHWIAQFGIAGPIIITGFALGVQSVSSAGALHLDDSHKKWGVSIFVLYLFQCLLGAIIHFFKPKNSTGRPPQNYFHAVLGLLIIALGLYQVRSGYREEWPNTTGREALPKGVDILWIIWAVLLPVLYGIGLAFLPKQYRQEAESRRKMPATSSDSSLEDLNGH